MILPLACMTRCIRRGVIIMPIALKAHMVCRKPYYYLGWMAGNNVALCLVSVMPLIEHSLPKFWGASAHACERLQIFVRVHVYLVNVLILNSAFLEVCYFTDRYLSLVRYHKIRVIRGGVWYRLAPFIFCIVFIVLCSTHFELVTTLYLPLDDHQGTGYQCVTLFLKNVPLTSAINYLIPLGMALTIPLIILVLLAVLILKFLIKLYTKDITRIADCNLNIINPPCNLETPDAHLAIPNQHVPKVKSLEVITLANQIRSPLSQRSTRKAKKCNNMQTTQSLPQRQAKKANVQIPPSYLRDNANNQNCKTTDNTSTNFGMSSDLVDEAPKNIPLNINKDMGSSLNTVKAFCRITKDLPCPQQPQLTAKSSRMLNRAASGKWKRAIGKTLSLLCQLLGQYALVTPIILYNFTFLILCSAHPHFKDPAAFNGCRYINKWQGLAVLAEILNYTLYILVYIFCDQNLRRLYISSCSSLWQFHLQRH